MANLAQKIAHTRMVFEIPGREVRWQPLDQQGPRSRARRNRVLQDGPKHREIRLRSHPQPIIEIALRPEVLRPNEDGPRIPNVRARAMARSVTSRSRATYTWPARRNSGSHAAC
jgi:hypothetical protein